MLKREHGGRRQEPDLRAVHDRLERGAHRHFRLAIADIPAEQAVHRRRRFHVAPDVGDRNFLVAGELILERVVELTMPVRVRAEGVPRHRLARRVQLEQLLGHVPQGTTNPGLGLGPGGSAEPVQGGFRGPGIFLQQVELLNRDEQLVLADVA